MTIPSPASSNTSTATPYSHAAKVLVVGEATVGKTSLIVRYVKGIFNPSYILTIGVNFFVQDVRVGDRILRLQIWDSAGQERFGPIRKLYYYGAKGVILVYDKTNERTFERLGSWLKEIEEHAGNIPITLVGNKADLEETISHERGMRFAQAHGLTFLEASAKTGHHTMKIFNLTASQIINYLARPR